MLDPIGLSWVQFDKYLSTLRGIGSHVYLLKSTNVLSFMFPQSWFFEVDMDMWFGCQDVIRILTTCFCTFYSLTPQKEPTFLS